MLGWRSCLSTVGCVLLAVPAWAAPAGQDPPAVQPATEEKAAELPGDEQVDPTTDETDEGDPGEPGAKPEGEKAAAGAAGAPADVPCDPAVDICLVAEKQGREKGHYWGRGFADLRFGDLQIQTDALDIYDVEKDGTVTQRLVAEGNVVLLRKDERVAGTRMTMDLDTGRGTMENVTGYIAPGVFFTAREIERLDPKTFRIKSGRFTSCCQPKPSWSFDAARAKLKVGKSIQAASVRFNLGVPLVGASVPALYIPYFVYPINEEGRSTGILFPSFNVDFGRGVDVRAGFFWAMGRSFDQTFIAEYRPQLAPLLGHELHYALAAPSRGSFVTHFFPPQSSTAAPVEGQPKPNEDWDYSLDWNAVQILPGGFRATVVAKVSSQQDYLVPVDSYFSQRSYSLTVQRTFGRHALLLKGSSVETIAQGGANPTRRYLPQLRLSQAPNPIGRSGILFEYAAQADRLSLRKTLAEGDLRNDWSRLDVGSALSRPVSWSFLSLTPRVRARYTYYSATMQEGAEGGVLPNQPYTGADLTRRYVEASLDLRGPRFARVFGSPIGAFSDKIKHVIGPEVMWVYRNAVDARTTIPRFDVVDNTFAANEVRYGLVNRFYARRKNKAGKPTPFEFLSWTVYRKHYIDPPLGFSDPDFTTPFLRVAGGAPPKDSPVRSVLSFKPAPGWSVDWTEEYDVDAQNTTRRDLRLGMGGAAGRLRASWTLQPQITDVDGTTVILPRDEAVGGWLDLGSARSAIALNMSAQYSLVQKIFINRSLQLRLSGQCLGVMLNVMERQYFRGQKPVRSFGFAIELANLGSIGMDPRRTGGAGGRRGF